MGPCCFPLVSWEKRMLVVSMHNWRHLKVQMCTSYLIFVMLDISCLFSLLVKSEVKVIHLCPTLCDPKDYTVHGILQARILEWVAFPFSRASSQPRNWTQVSPHCRQILYQLSYKGSPRSSSSSLLLLGVVAYPFSSRSSQPRSWTKISCISG